MNTETTTTTIPELTFDPRTLTEAQFAQFGVSHVAYIKAIVIEGKRVFAIHAANGTPMALAEDNDSATAAIVQHEMIPAQVH